MKMEVRDAGTKMNRLHSRVADIISIVLGQRVNYMLRYYSNRHRFPNLRHPKDLSERILSSMLSKDFLKYADYAVCTIQKPHRNKSDKRRGEPP